jgi:hypothetical protein
MKPGYIFFAVLVVSLILAGALPRLGSTTGISAPPEGSSAASLPIVTVRPPDTSQQPAVPPTPGSQESSPSVVIIPEPPPLQLDESNASDPSAAGDLELMKLVHSVYNRQPGSVAGVYAPGLFGMPVVGQPSGDEEYISEDENTLTQYGTPAQYGVIALLAHNSLNSGRLVSRLAPGQEVYVLYGDGKVSRYCVSSVQYYQALSPHDSRSDFRDLNRPGGEILTYDQLFNRVYTTASRLVFQTCLEANGNPSWGRIFISAEPVS